MRYLRLLLAIIALVFATIGSAVAGPKAPSGLMCDFLASPELTTISDQTPSFSWIVNDSRRGAVQSAYQIVIASMRATAEQGKGDVWDSGKVNSTESVNVQIAGGKLPIAHTYFWRVRTWDRDGAVSPWSTVQRFAIAEKATSNAELLPPKNFANRYPIEQTKVDPVRFARMTNGPYFIDFGKAAFGTIELMLTAKTTNVVEVHLGEVLASDGKIDRNPGGSRRYRKMLLPLKPGTHTYTVEIPSDKRNSSGAAIKVKEFMPDVMPFRYCELVNVPGDLNRKAVRQIAAHYHFDDDAAEFSSSDKILDGVWNLCKYSIKATSFIGVYIDGDRERIPYEGDAYINQLCQYSVDREYSLARYSIEYLLAHPTWPMEWQMHMPFMAWNDYLYTGDRNFLTAHYDDLAAKTLIKLARADGLIVEDKARMTADLKKALHRDTDLRAVVDWPPTSKARPAGERDGYDMKPVNTVANAFHYRTLIVMRDIANALHKTAEAKEWDRRAGVVKASFQRAFFDATGKRYIDGEGSSHSSLHANMFALTFGLVPDEHVADVIAFIKTRGMACSVYGAQHLLDGLYEASAADYGLSLLTATDDRSWYHMQQAGSTITMEAWDNKYKENQDWNHAWGAAPANLIPRRLMGIEPIAPGFARARIHPQLASLESASILYPTIRGDIKLAVKQSRDCWSAAVTVPANMSAEIYIPAVEISRITESGVLIDKADQVKFLRVEKGACVLEVASGSYNFRVTK